jgi:hypothetical protein
VTGCECQIAGFCKRHQCNKTEHFHKLCRTRPDYFTLYEEGRGPACVSESAARAAAVGGSGRVGLGDVVAWLAGLIGVKPWPGCGCKTRKEWLNRVTLWGWWRAA